MSNESVATLITGLAELNASTITLIGHLSGGTEAGSAAAKGEAKSDSKPLGKRGASKKRAAKRGKAKEPDYSDIVDFKKAMFAIADGAGLEGDSALKKLKAYFSETEYAASDEVEVEDRAQFLVDLKAFIEGESEDETENFDI